MIADLTINECIPATFKLSVKLPLFSQKIIFIKIMMTMIKNTNYFIISPPHNIYKYFFKIGGVKLITIFFND